MAGAPLWHEVPGEEMDPGPSSLLQARRTVGFYVPICTPVCWPPGPAQSLVQDKASLSPFPWG